MTFTETRLNFLFIMKSKEVFLSRWFQTLSTKVGRVTLDRDA